MRPFLTLAVVLASACSFYAPVVPDCTVTCGAAQECPSGFTCRGTFCRPSTAGCPAGAACRPAQGPTEDCECRAGSTRACGTDEGECSAGTQACSTQGRWGACEGETAPVPEACDGKDNDCDGLVDMGPLKTILTDNTGPFEGFWRLHGHDGGYTLVTPLAIEDGGARYHALFYDEQLEPRGRSAPIVEGSWRRMDSVAEGATIYAAYSFGDAVRVSRITAEGVVSQLGEFPDAGYDGRMYMGAGPRGLVTTWRTVDLTARVARWARQGGVPRVYDLPALPEGTLWWLDATTDGQYVVLEAELPDGGYMDAVQDIDKPAPETTNAPYYRSAKFMTRRSGQVVHLDILDLEGATKVVFYRDYKTQAADAYMEVEQDGRWHDIDFVLDDAENLVAAYVNDESQQMVLARIEGTSSTDQQVTRKVLAGVTVPVTSASGNVRVAKVPGDPMFGLAWSTRQQVFARRVCAP